MSWTTTWPEGGVPQYAPHESEAAAAQHADELVASGRAWHATYFETTDRPAAKERP